MGERVSECSEGGREGEGMEKGGEGGRKECVYIHIYTYIYTSVALACACMYIYLSSLQAWLLPSSHLLSHRSHF